MKKLIYIFIFFGLYHYVPLYSQDDTTSNPYEISDTLFENFGLFSNDEVLEITLRFDINKYRKSKPKEEYMPALLTYHINATDSINKEIRLKSRGEFRNGYCNFPPIRLNFKKTEFDNPDLKKLEKVKMVTHCISGTESYLFKEYLIYKLYNVLTDNSFRVRLLKVTYINTHKVSKPIDTYAFIIEPIEFLAERLKIIPTDQVKLTQHSMDPESIDRLAIFNYMIGNTDWSVPNQHNVKIFSQPNSANPGLGMVIPYDFDYSGLVNASYAIPAEGLPIENIRQRIYQGLCRSEEVYLKALQEFSDKKNEFYRTINDFPYLSDRIKKEMSGYLDEFFSQFDKRNSIIYGMLKDCKK